MGATALLLLIASLAGTPTKGPKPDVLDPTTGLPRVAQPAFTKWTPGRRHQLTSMAPKLREVRVAERNSRRVREWRDDAQTYGVLWLAPGSNGGGGYRAARILPDAPGSSEWHYELLEGDQTKTGKAKVHRTFDEAEAAVLRNWWFLMGKKQVAAGG